MKINYTKILVPYDNSLSAKAALKSALVSARAFDASLDICYVVRNVEEEKVKVISREIDQVKEKNSDLKINFMVRNGKIYKEVVKLEKELGINLIVMGTHGSQGISSMLGSNAYKVVSSSSCPVIVMGENATKDTIARILLPLDDSQETRQKVPFVVQFAKGFNAEVIISLVSTSENNETKKRLRVYQSQTEDYLNKHHVKYKIGTSKYGGNLADTCLQLAKDQDANIIVMMTETESSGMFMGTFASQIVHKAEVPIMAIHARSLTGVGSSGY
jgi:nucleotide-binding universal stress UspA family protein